MDHLLRTLAAVPPGSRVLVLGDVPASAPVSLRSLGFDVETASGEMSGIGPSQFDWVAAWMESVDAARGAASEIARVLSPGAWAWISVAREGEAPEALTDAAMSAGLALSERPVAVSDSDGSRIRGIYRRVDDTTTA